MTGEARPTPSRALSMPPPVPAGPSMSGKKKGIVASIHGIAHAESWAIDLMWDLLLRFAYDVQAAEPSFWDDFLRIVREEAEHFLSWTRRLEEGYGIRYGTLPVHDALWECAEASKDDVMARFSLINLLQEARGLDTSEITLQRLLRAGDPVSAETLRKNAKEEEGHVAAGIKWFCYVKDKRLLQGSCESYFHRYVKERYRGRIVPPFNVEARRRAGMCEAWYFPLVTPSKKEREAGMKQGSEHT
ncbi:hypothetical protein NSK_005883 [Nannochloropsis salina CCMP1776]|uniref:DUF455 domain-containing protein n=1 Tax=Nannochloropsis salina CCMP1776 TaxID=1027361 RepID=A0A4D9D2D4_9STRA|nr:hypothetical protein NSK_005883 [Nannochloropsis salina CCMP1776]|eukprot:TFJ82808.1 hypothetical protein NSK_005883 [Nannochloropsis salina CCMP1776]